MHSNIVVLPIPFDPQMILKCGLKSKCNLNIGPIPFISIEFIRNICISSIQRHHYITSSYSYQFFEKNILFLIAVSLCTGRRSNEEYSGL